MSSIGIKLPINKDTADGFLMLKSIAGTIKQNFKMLVLTNPGERVMEPNFGVGVMTYLFANYTAGVENLIREKVREQAATYIPSIKVISVDFLQARDSNTLNIHIRYAIPKLGTKDLLEITI